MKDAMLAEACEPVAELLRTMNALLAILEGVMIEQTTAHTRETPNGLN
jgi:hypothetical protein